MLIEEDFRTAKTDLNWKHSRIRKLAHYRRFVLFMVTCLVFAMLIGASAQRKPSLISKIVRTRKGEWDCCITRIGLLLLQTFWLPIRALPFCHIHIGVDTPETVHAIEGVQPWGPEASAFTKKLLVPPSNWKWMYRNEITMGDYSSMYTFRTGIC
jgi:hypothetical protein